MLAEERQELVEYATELSELTPGRTGNLSCRRGDHIAISPTGIVYNEYHPSEIPVVSHHGELVNGQVRPSSELEMHLRVYEAFECGAVVHTHSPWATTLSVLREELPPVHYMIGLAGSRIPVAEYATFGTPDLAENAVTAMRDAEATACLLANHGVLARGVNLSDAMETVRSIESIAQVYCLARAIGDPTELPPDEMTRIINKLSRYRQ